jgi:hypothetical protein
VKQFCIRAGAAEAEPGINTSYEVVMSTSKGSATSLVVPVLDRGELVALI